MACAVRALGVLASTTSSSPASLLTVPTPPAAGLPRPQGCVRPARPVPVRMLTTKVSTSHALGLRSSHAAWVSVSLVTCGTGVASTLLQH